MKKAIISFAAILLTFAVLTLSLVSCGKDETSNEDSSAENFSYSASGQRLPEIPIG